MKKFVPQFIILLIVTAVVLIGIEMADGSGSPLLAQSPVKPTRWYDPDWCSNNPDKCPTHTPTTEPTATATYPPSPLRWNLSKRFF